MNNSLYEDGFWEPCEGKPKSRGHSEYGYCQAGTSAVVDSVCLLLRPGLIVAEVTAEIAQCCSKDCKQHK